MECKTIIRLFHRLTRHQWIIDTNYIEEWGNSCDLKNPLTFSHIQHSQNQSSPSDPRLESDKDLTIQNIPVQIEQEVSALNNNDRTIVLQKPSATYNLPNMNFAPDEDLDKIFSN